MDDFSARILNELMGAEKERPAPAASKPEPQNSADHWTRAILLERGVYLGKLAKYGNGSESETLKDYPQHSVMLSFQSRSGDAEVHENHADIFYVVEGSATLVTGGTVEGATAIGPGEFRGPSLVGGVRRQLRAGDVAHVPAGQPHQWLVEGEKSVACLVIRIRQNP